MMESTNGSEDHYRLALLLTDALGDLQIHNNKDGQEVLWTPESIIQALKEERNNSDAGISLADNLIVRLLEEEVQQGKPTTTSNYRRLQSWDDILLFSTTRSFQTYLPPWVVSASRDHFLPDHPLITTTKLEILSFLASTLQNRMLQKSKSATTDDETPPKGKEGSPHELDLPEYLSQEQKEIVLECYRGIKENYDKRRKGMQQRLDILVANFEADNPDEKAISEIKERLKSLSIYSSTVSTQNTQMIVDLDEESVLKHFSSPHSIDVKRTANSKMATNTDPIIQVQAENPGGKLDDFESRVSMPEWSNSKKI